MVRHYDRAKWNEMQIGLREVTCGIFSCKRAAMCWAAIKCKIIVAQE